MTIHILYLFITKLNKREVISSSLFSARNGTEYNNGYTNIITDYN